MFLFAGLAWAGLFLIVWVSWTVYTTIKERGEIQLTPEEHWRKEWEEIERDING